MDEQKECENCGRTVKAWDLDRYGECGACRAEERESDMTVGDLNK